MVNDHIIFSVIRGDKSLPTLQYRGRKKSKGTKRGSVRRSERDGSQ